MTPKLSHLHSLVAVCQWPLASLQSLLWHLVSMLAALRAGCNVASWCACNSSPLLTRMLCAPGHTYLTYGPLLNAATNVMYEGIPLHPQPDRMWRIVEKYQARAAPAVLARTPCRKSHAELDLCSQML